MTDTDAPTVADERGEGLADLLRYLLVLSRPRFWLYLAGPVAVGVTYGIGDVSGLFTPVTVGLAAYFLVPANVHLYGVNDAFDADIDEL
ncbi:lycopene elongase, partial [Halorubrum sp. SD626R]